MTEIIERHDDSAFALVRQLEDSGALTPVSLVLDDPDLPFERYEALAGFFGSIKRSCAFWIGDLLNYGEIVYGESYAQAEAATGLTIETLRTYCYVCRSVARSRRIPALSFGHHAAVAPLEPGEQRRWLKAAEKNGWSRREMRAEILAADAQPPPPEQPQWTPADELTAPGTQTAVGPSQEPLGGSGAGTGTGTLQAPPALTEAVRRLVANAIPLGAHGYRVTRESMDELAALVADE